MTTYNFTGKQSMQKFFNRYKDDMHMTTVGVYAESLFSLCDRMVWNSAIRIVTNYKIKVTI